MGRALGILMVQLLSVQGVGFRVSGISAVWALGLCTSLGLGRAAQGFGIRASKLVKPRDETLRRIYNPEWPGPLF